MDVRARGLEDAVRNVCRRELDPVVDEMWVDDALVSLFSAAAITACSSRLTASTARLRWAATSSARFPATISCWPAHAATGRRPPQRAAEVAMAWSALSSSAAVPPALRACAAYGSPPPVPRESPCRPS